mgnify:CR=1 FL=1
MYRKGQEESGGEVERGSLRARIVRQLATLMQERDYHNELQDMVRVAEYEIKTMLPFEQCLV